MSARAWSDTLEEHRRALREVIATARDLAQAEWSRPRREGAWSPAEIVEHLCLTYERFTAELTEGRAMRVRLGFWWRCWVRVRYLPGILRSRRFPVAARAPRELRPGAAADTPAAGTERLERCAAAFEAALAPARERKGARVTHPIFGSLRLRWGVEFVAIHLAHHCRQLRAPSS
jgi:hypothetical protein